MNPQVPNITSLYNTPDITNAQTQANTSAQTASNYQSAAAQLPAALKKAIEDKLNYNQDIISQQAKAQANYFAAPAQARQQYQDITNPFDREALVAQSVANAYAPYQSLTDILGQRQGNIQDIVNAGTGAFNSQVTAEQNASQIAQQNLQNLLANADRLASAKEWQYQASLPGGGSGSASSIQEAQALQGLQKDVQAGMHFDVLLQRYGSVLNEYQIRQAYNAGPAAKKWGPAKETPTQENALLQGLPGLTGAKASPKTTTTTLSAKTSTVKGNTKVDGWNLKLSNGQTMFITTPTGTTGGFGGIFGLGKGLFGTPVKQPTQTPQQIYNDWKSAKLPEDSLIQALKNSGYTIQ